jgi:hypothetical protein
MTQLAVRREATVLDFDDHRLAGIERGTDLLDCGRPVRALTTPLGTQKTISAQERSRQTGDYPTAPC